MGIQRKRALFRYVAAMATIVAVVYGVAFGTGGKATWNALIGSHLYHLYRM